MCARLTLQRRLVCRTVIVLTSHAPHAAVEVAFATIQIAYRLSDGFQNCCSADLAAAPTAPPIAGSAVTSTFAINTASSSRNVRYVQRRSGLVFRALVARSRHGLEMRLTSPGRLTCTFAI